MSHAPFIVAAYAVFFAVLLVDALTPVVARRQLIQRLRARYARQAQRERA